jgi:malate dehydrogenase
VLRAAKGEKGLVEPSYVYLPGVPGGEAIAKATGVDFFSVPVELGVSQDSSPNSKDID